MQTKVYIINTVKLEHVLRKSTHPRHIHTYTSPSICNSSKQADRAGRAIVASVAISNPAQRRFFFLLVWRRVLRSPALPIFFMLVLHPRDDNAKERERTKPSSIDCIHPLLTPAPMEPMGHRDAPHAPHRKKI